MRNIWKSSMRRINQMPEEVSQMRRLRWRSSTNSNTGRLDDINNERLPYPEDYAHTEH